MFKKYKLLIVDDEEITLEMLADFLEEYFEVTACANGFDALIAAKELTFDAVVLDINMPKMNGLELCEKLKEDPNYEYVPILFLTGSSDIRVIEEAFSVGGIDYILKPVVLEELYIRTKKHIQNAKQNEKLYTKQMQLNQKLEESIKQFDGLEEFGTQIENLYTYLQEQRKLLDAAKKVLK